MGHPDFRVGGRIFATLGYPDEGFAALVLTPDEQKKLLETNPDALAPAAGACGRRGNTIVKLDAVDVATLREAMTSAWRARALKGVTKSVSSASTRERKQSRDE